MDAKKLALEEEPKLDILAISWQKWPKLMERYFQITRTIIKKQFDAVNSVWYAPKYWKCSYYMSPKFSDVCLRERVPSMMRQNCKHP